ncbi:hypothetical protein BH24BAC1_BH24BAC1_21900 [soil metagenome]|jgi:hypothetical protein
MIKFLLITFLIYLTIRLVAPIIFRWWLKSFVNKHIRNGQFQNPYQAAGHPPRPDKPEGALNIDYIPEEPPKEPKDFKGGEYVDYEEVK